jgi:hypothetical protein
MGNNVFRFFLEWLKNEMHEEAYARLVQKADRREMAMRAKNIGASNTGNGPGWIYSEAISENKDANAVEYSVTDQMYTLATSFVGSLDEIWQSYVGGEQEIEDQDDVDKDAENEDVESKPDEPLPTNAKEHPHLWELAQAEGDDLWLQWINDHIWTYIGLSAPLLGAINPLRAVLSGENMGLPMTEENARGMELCK